MKRICALMLILMLVIPAAVMAEAKPKISFSSDKYSVVSGETAVLKLQADSSCNHDIEIIISDGDNNRYPVVLKAGETETEWNVETNRSTSKKRTYYYVRSNEQYSRGKTWETYLTAQAVVMAKFANQFQQTYLRKDATIKFTVEGSGTLENGTPIYLLNDDGEVIEQFAYKNNQKTYKVTYTMDESWRPMKTLHVKIEGREEADDTMRLFVGNPDEISIYGVKRDDNKIAFTMDCGASSAYAYRILDTLDEYGVKITFFVTGNFAAHNPDLVAEMLKRGHEIGNHSYNHPHMLDMENSKIWKEAVSASDMLESITGLRPALYRPPFGDANGRIRAIIEGAGMTVIRWTHSTGDSDETNQDPARSFKGATTDIVGGSIILSHLDSRATTTALPQILQWYFDHGFEVVKVSELLLKGDVTVQEIKSKGYQVYRSELN